MMQVKVLFFAASRDVVGTRELEIDLPDGVRTIGSFVSFLSERYPDLDGRLGSVRIAKNESFVRDDASIDEGDVLAVIPPVAGG